MSQPNLQCMGIDVAKLSLDIATTDTIEPFTVGNDEDGFAVITDKLKHTKINLILMEATGGLEAAIACKLQSEGYDVVVITHDRLGILPVQWDIWLKQINLTPPC